MKTNAVAAELKKNNKKKKPKTKLTNLRYLQQPVTCQYFMLFFEDVYLECGKRTLFTSLTFQRQNKSLN